MAYQMVATVVTLNDLEGHSSVAGVFKCNQSNICAAFYIISTDSVLARFLCISRASCFTCNHGLSYWRRRLAAADSGVLGDYIVGLWSSYIGAVSPQ